MKFTERIAKGEMLNIYKNGDQAVKVFDPQYPKTRVLYEAFVQANVEDTGLPVPKINEVALEEGKWILSMDLIEGKTLGEIMKEDPENEPAYIEKMVDLQMMVHEKRAPKLNKLKDRFVDEIKKLDDIDENRRYELLTRLDSMPKHVKLCHGNFDPNNIIIKGDEYYIIDWIRASQGNASADVAQTYLLLSLHSKDAAEAYLTLFCEKSNTEKKYVQAWLPIVAAARLSEKIPQEREMLMRWIDVVDYE